MTTIAGQLWALLEKDPGRIAIYLQRAGQSDLPISYERLMAGAAAYSQAYTAEGMQPGEVIVLILQHGEELIYAFWGAILNGTIPSIMPFLTEKLSPERYRADLAALVAVTHPAAIVTYAEFEGEVQKAISGDSSVRKVFVVERIQPQVNPDNGSSSGLKRSPGDIALLQHSSGTTGLQKGVALSHVAVFNQLNAYSKALDLNEQDVIVSWLPLYHDMGLIAGFLMPVLTGIPLVLSSPFDWVRAPHRLLQSITEYKGSLTWLPNFAFNFLAQKTRARDLSGVDLSSWRAVINCSEPVRAESHRAFYERFKPFGLREGSLQTCYAMAENVFGVTQSDLDSEPVVEEVDCDSFLVGHKVMPPEPGRPFMKMMSSGRPLSNTEVRVLDEHGNIKPDRFVGEIALKSDCMLNGYYNRPEVTETSFRNGWFLTGDYGYLSNGEVFVSGRKKDLIIVGGKNVYPQDLEALTYEVSGVHSGRSVAFGNFDEEQGTEEVVIIVEVDSDDPGLHERVAEEVRKHVTRNSAIALRMVKVVGPHWIIKTSSGKTARSANRMKYLQESADEGFQR